MTVDTAAQHLRAVLDEIQRRQVHARRLPRPVATAEQFSAFLLRRHHLHPEHRLVGPPGVLAALELLQGDDVPLRVWEQDLLSARVEDYRREWLDRLGLGGEIVWTVFEPTAGDRARGRVGVALRDNVGWLRESVERPVLRREQVAPQGDGSDGGEEPRTRARLTWSVRFADWPTIGPSVLVVAAAWFLSRRTREDATPTT